MFRNEITKHRLLLKVESGSVQEKKDVAISRH